MERGFQISLLRTLTSSILQPGDFKAWHIPNYGLQVLPPLSPDWIILPGLIPRPWMMAQTYRASAVGRSPPLDQMREEPPVVKVLSALQASLTSLLFVLGLLGAWHCADALGRRASQGVAGRPGLPLWLLWKRLTLCGPGMGCKRSMG